MKIHPQLLRTMHLIEEMRRGGKTKVLNLRFGTRGLESVIIDGQPLDAGEVEFLRQGQKLLDSTDAKKLV